MVCLARLHLHFVTACTLFAALVSPSPDPVEQPPRLASNISQDIHQLLSVPFSTGSSALDRRLSGLAQMASFEKQHHRLEQWHPGELAVHRLLKVPTRGNPTSHGLPPHYAYRVQVSPLVAVGALEKETGRPWTSVWGGEAGFAGQIAPSVLGMRSLVDRAHDPVVQALFGHLKDGETIRPPTSSGHGDGEGASDYLGGAQAMSGLSIDLDTRDRVKLAGRLLAGGVSAPEGDPGKGVGEVQLAFQVLESVGNCPKYLNRKAIWPHVPRPGLVSDSLHLPADAVALLGRADLFFLTSSDGRGRMDTNHRGGSPGLVRVAENREDGGGTTLVYPEFSGNRLYQTLGNLHVNPRIGIAVPDFETGDVLYVTGRTRLLVGAEAATLLPHCKLAVRIEVDAVRFVRDGLPFRGDWVDYSPYNPPIRRLASELQGAGAPAAAAGVAVATLMRREVLTPSVARFTFSLRRNGDSISRGPESGDGGNAGPGNQMALRPLWEPGQHVTLDFGPELDSGWSHMRDDDPQSLNDDFVRTFTVSSPGASRDAGASGGTAEGEEMQITVRNHGPATDLLFNWNTRVPLELPVLGFGGEARFRLPVSLPGGPAEDGQPDTTSVFVAAGVGITPLLAQAAGVLAGPGGRDNLVVLWSLRAEDLGLAVDSLSRTPGLGAATTLFVTGPGEETGLEKRVRELNAVVHRRRMEKSDLLAAAATQTTSSPSEGEEGLRGPKKRKFYLCMGPGLLKAASAWLEKEDFVTESFEY